MVKKAVIPIAGYGTRMLPATMAIPKTMLNVVDKPIIEYLIDEIVAAGISDVLLITNLGSSIIENHFARSYELEHFIESTGDTELLEKVKHRYTNINIYIKRASTNESLAQSVIDAKHFVGDSPFLLVLGDEMFDFDEGCSKKLVDTYNECKVPVIAVKRVERSQIKNYGIVEGWKYKEDKIVIENMIEKPKVDETESDLAIIGRYVLNNSIFETIDKQMKEKGKCDFTTAILDTKEIKFAVEISGERFDCGSKIGLIKANIKFRLEE